MGHHKQSIIIIRSSGSLQTSGLVPWLVLTAQPSGLPVNKSAKT